VAADIADKLTDGEGRVELLGIYPGIQSGSIVNKKKEELYSYMCAVKRATT
jgi:hypothetical protein